MNLEKTQKIVAFSEASMLGMLGGVTITAKPLSFFHSRFHSLVQTLGSEPSLTKISRAFSAVFPTHNFKSTHDGIDFLVM